MRAPFIYQIDRTLTLVVERIPNKARKFMLRLSTATHPVIWGIVLGFAATISWGADNHQLAYACFVTVVVLPLEQLLKQVFRRKRPETMYVDNMKFRSYSFPSGHAYAAVVVLGLLSVAVYSLTNEWLGWVIGVVAALLTIVIGASRVYLGAHFPTDVIAGWAIGIAVFMSLAELGLYHF